MARPLTQESRGARHLRNELTRHHTQSHLPPSRAAGYKCGGTLCCVDCSKDFTTAGARAHTTCISEAEKYEGALYRGARKAGKVDPQELWTQHIAKAVSLL